MVNQVSNTSDDVLSKPDRVKMLLLLLLGSFNFEQKFKPALIKILETYSSESLNQASKEINKIGCFNINEQQKENLINDIVDNRMSFLLPEIERVTKEKISNDISTANNKKELINAIASSYAVSNDRVNAIKDIEQRTINNSTRIETAKISEIVGGVLVSDGQEFDEPCIEADGQVWSLDYAGDNILQHPRCVRQFTFLSSDEVKEHGGFDRK
ncbi:hypothetical protein [Pectinatus frisingensis]|uniref:hypothetical protein n=1 Tax=Pectinatus frisingensis TaxID=865 RepID=UPI0018C66F01|nr:hypothetical protein [Pectinatus frisingensis]